MNPPTTKPRMSKIMLTMMIVVVDRVIPDLNRYRLNVETYTKIILYFILNTIEDDFLI